MVLTVVAHQYIHFNHSKVIQAVPQLQQNKVNKCIVVAPHPVRRGAAFSILHWP